MPDVLNVAQKVNDRLKASENHSRQKGIAEPAAGAFTLSADKEKQERLEDFFHQAQKNDGVEQDVDGLALLKKTHAGNRKLDYRYRNKREQSGERRHKALWNGKVGD